MKILLVALALIGTLIHYESRAEAQTPTNTPTSTPTRTPTLTPTNTPTLTPTPTDTPTFTRTPTNTKTPTRTPTNTRTPTLTPTGRLTPTTTPANGTASHVTALEMTLLGGIAEMPLYSTECIANNYVPNPRDPEQCRCVLYFKRVSGTISLNYRCPDGVEHAITAVP